MECKQGKYYKLVSANGESVIGYFYNNPDFHLKENMIPEDGKDYSQTGFGFNTADGGGFLPFYDLSPNTKVHEIEMAVIKNEKDKDLFSIFQMSDKVQNYSFSCVNRDDTTFTLFSNSWKPAMLIGEMACATKMVVDHESANHRVDLKAGETKH